MSRPIFAEQPPLILLADELEWVPPSLLYARGNVRLSSPWGEIHTDALEFSRETEIVRIPHSALITGDFFSFTLEGLAFHIRKEEGNFHNARGFLLTPRGGKIYFSSSLGSFKENVLNLTDVQIAPYEPMNKSLIRLHISSWAVQLEEKWTQLHRTDFFLFHKRVFRLKNFTQTFREKEKSFLPLVPVFGLHRDSGMRLGFRTYFPFSPSLSSEWEIGGTSQKDWWGYSSLSYKNTLFLLYGKRFLVNEFNQGMMVFFLPSLSLYVPARVGNATFSFTARKDWLQERSVSGEREGITFSAYVPFMRFGKNSRVVYTGKVSVEHLERREEERKRNFWTSSVLLERRKEESFLTIGWNGTEENRPTLWNFARVRETQSVVFRWQKRVSPHWEMGAGTFYDWKHKNFPAKDFLLGYHYRGVIFYAEVSLEQAGMILWLGIEGL
ncbi:MAG: hypothetical protein V2G33_04695 [bacterium JZ-2024 1]